MRDGSRQQLEEAEADAAALAAALRDLTVKYARNGWHYKDADMALDAHDARLRRGQEGTTGDSALS